MHKPVILLTIILLTGTGTVSPAADREVSQPLTLTSFIERATRNDTNFERILIDQLALKYRRDVLLPDSDLIMDIKHKHHVYIEQGHDSAETAVTLSKLFPYNGTDISLSYNRFPATDPVAVEESSLQLLISQPIAQNAFGKGTRLLDRIIGIENDIARYQIVEAYEDYLASLTAAYYNWYTAYENLKTGEASYRSNQKLMKDIRARQRQKIALPIDVNKMKLLLIGKQENVIILNEIYNNYSNLIFKAIRHQGAESYIPARPEPATTKIDFDSDYRDFTETSRTYKALQLLEQQGTLEVKKAADDMLPSTSLLLGYKLDGRDWGIRDEERGYFAGFELRWPLGRTVGKANKQLADIERRKTVLSNLDKYEELRTNLKNLYQQIQREKELIDIAREKIRLSESILRDESENYSFGKVTLNDYIDAVNRADENRFSYTEHQVQLNKLLIEWLRLTDRLVSENQVLKNQVP